ncbi:MAG TPA: hypothetical protein VI197_06345 [Polyangiaceae bacterium]
MVDVANVLARLRESAAADAALERPTLLPPAPDAAEAPYRVEAYVCGRCGSRTPAVVTGGLAFCDCDFASDPGDLSDQDPPHGARRRAALYGRRWCVAHRSVSRDLRMRAARRKRLRSLFAGSIGRVSG